MNHISIVLMLLIIALQTTQAQSGESWTRLDTRVFDDSYANLDIVPLNGQRFRAYYMKEGSIGTAVSEDDGETFTDEGTILSGQHHALLKLSDTLFRMYYSTSDSGGLISATSTDGTTFTQEDGIRLTGAGQIIHPSAMEQADGTFRIFYDQEVSANPNFGRNIRSISCDATGLTCTQDSGVRIKRRSDCDDLSRSEMRRLKLRGTLCDVGLVFSPFVEFDASTDQFRLYFTAEGNQRNSGVYLATSTNGRRFKIRKKVLGVNTDTTVENGNLGLPGNPQDAFILTQSSGTKRMFIWETDDGIYAATRSQ
ncbi:MAG: hypothetical protein QY326_08240 [Bdellovibrionota bacterium]|nr:MAG: hypothetical protein QY326_08240 [Bdellovibrionota bacterium]